MFLVDPIAKHVDQRRVIDRYSVSRRCLNIEHQIRGIGINGICSGRDALRFGQINWRCRFVRMTESGPISQHLALFPSGEVGKSFSTGRTPEGEETVAVNS